MLYPPLGRLGIGSRHNTTLHGRSHYRTADVPGHNVFNGYRRPGWGDGVDLFCQAGSPVYALEDCRQILHCNDDSRLEVIYLQGAQYLVVLAHVNAVHSGPGHSFRRGDVVAHVRSELKDPHVHLEIARGQRGSEVPLTGKTPAELAAKLRGLCLPEIIRVVNVGNGAVLGAVSSLENLPRRWPGCTMAPGGDHRADQGKVYVELG